MKLKKHNKNIKLKKLNYFKRIKIKNKNQHAIFISK